MTKRVFVHATDSVGDVRIVQLTLVESGGTTSLSETNVIVQDNTLDYRIGCSGDAAFVAALKNIGGGVGDLYTYAHTSGDTYVERAAVSAPTTYVLGSIAISPGGSWIAAWRGDGGIDFFKLNTGDGYHHYDHTVFDVGGMIFDGTKLAFAGERRLVLALSTTYRALSFDGTTFTPTAEWTSSRTDRAPGAGPGLAASVNGVEIVAVGQGGASFPHHPFFEFIRYVEHAGYNSGQVRLSGSFYNYGSDDTGVACATCHDGSRAAFIGGWNVDDQRVQIYDHNASNYTDIGIVSLGTNQYGTDVAFSRDGTTLLIARYGDTGDQVLIYYSNGTGPSGSYSLAGGFNSTHVPTSGSGYVNRMVFGDDAGLLGADSSDITDPAEGANFSGSFSITYSGTLTATDPAEAVDIDLEHIADRMAITDPAESMDFDGAFGWIGAMAATDPEETVNFGFANINEILNESVVVTVPSLLAEQITRVFESLRLRGTSSSVLSALNSLVNNARFNELITIVRDVLISEAIALSGTATPEANKIAILVDRMVMQGLAASQLEGITLVSLALALNESVVGALEIRATDGLLADASISDKIVAFHQLVSQAAYADTVAAQAVSKLTLSENLLAQVLATQQLTATEHLAELGEFDALIEIEGLPFVGWATNTENLASSEYAQYPFESMARLGNKYYGAGEGGLFRLDGDDDDGDPIAASVLTGQLDFGSTQLKHLQAAYIGHSANGDMILKVITAHRGVQAVNVYRMVRPNNAGDEFHEGRVVTGRALKSRYWQFELQNVAGADFTIDDVTFDTVILGRRV